MVERSHFLGDFFLQIGETIVHLAGGEKLSQKFAFGEKRTNIRHVHSWVDTHYGRNPNLDFSYRTGFMITKGL